MSAPSLLQFLDAPVLVGDPEGRVVYMNPAFESRFAADASGARGMPVAMLFEGGVREAVLRGIAEACDHGASVRFRLRHAGVGYASVASPITAEDARVGFVIMLVETTADDERIPYLGRQIRDRVEDVERVVDELLEQTGGRRHEKYRALGEEAARNLAMISKWCDELACLVTGRPLEEKRKPIKLRLDVDVDGDG